MTDINRMNNVNGINKIQQSQMIKQTQNNQESSADSKTIEDLSGQADIVGRSQVNKADNLKEDVNFILKNPDIVAKTEAFFNLAYAQLLREDSPNAYEKAAAMATTFARELAGK